MSNHAHIHSTTQRSRAVRHIPLRVSRVVAHRRLDVAASGIEVEGRLLLVALCEARHLLNVGLGGRGRAQLTWRQGNKAILWRSNGDRPLRLVYSGCDTQLETPSR